MSSTSLSHCGRGNSAARNFSTLLKKCLPMNMNARVGTTRPQPGGSAPVLTECCCRALPALSRLDPPNGLSSPGLRRAVSGSRRSRGAACLSWWTQLTTCLPGFVSGFPGVGGVLSVLRWRSKPISDRRPPQRGKPCPACVAKRHSVVAVLALSPARHVSHVSTSRAHALPRVTEQVRTGQPSLAGLPLSVFT